MEEEATELAQLGELADIEIGRRERRAMCESCWRPIRVCWCQDLTGDKVPTTCRVVLLQHPHEEKRCLRTAPILQALMPQGQYIEFKGKKFSPKRFSQLAEVLQSESSFILYPGNNALSLDQLPPVISTPTPYNMIILDGTWDQAKSMLYRSPCLQKLKQVQLTGYGLSQYVIRTQPTEGALSTVETAAIALATLEKDWSIYSSLIKPLKQMCQFQMNHGAVVHHSKEQLLLTGQYKKKCGKRTFRKLKKCGAKNDKVTLQQLLRNSQSGLGDSKRVGSLDPDLSEFQGLSLSSSDPGYESQLKDQATGDLESR